MPDPKYANLVDLEHLSRFKDKCDILYATNADLSDLADTVAGIITTGGEPNVIEIVKVNNTALVPDSNKAVNVTVPTTVAELTDHSDYALISDIPTAVSELTNDSGYQTAANVATAISGKADTADLGTAAAKDFETTVANDANLPTGAAVQTYVTGLGYQTSSQVATIVEAYGYQDASDVSGAISDALANSGDAYATTSDVSSAISTALTSALVYKGVKATVGDLPASGQKVGDMWHVTADGGEYAWDGSAWQEMGSVVDLSPYALDSDFTIVTNNQIDGLFTSGS